MKRFLLLMAVLSSLFLLSCGGEIETGTEKPERVLIKGVQTKTVHTFTTTKYYETSATVRSRNTSLVSSRIMGVTGRIYVKEGEAVKKGDILIKLISPEIDARLQQAKETVEETKKAYDMARQQRKLMEKTYHRYENLYKERVITEQEFDEIKTKMKLAELDVERAERALKRSEAALKEATVYKDYTLIRSPLDGVVAEKLINEGSMANPGRPLLKLEDPVYRLEAPVDERLLGRIHTGMEVLFEIPSLNVSMTGRISEIVHQVDPLTRTFTIKVSLLENLNLKGGISGKVKIPLYEKKTLLVPEGAIVKRGEIRALYVVGEDNVVKMRLVRTGRVVDGLVEVLSGLSEGEIIIVKGIDKVVDGGVLEATEGTS